MGGLLWIGAALRKGAAPRWWVLTAIGASALVFALGHLPAAAAITGQLDLPVVAWVVVANAVFGIVAGLLFVRRGLESAMLAHAIAHLVAWTALG